MLKLRIILDLNKNSSEIAHSPLLSNLLINCKVRNDYELKILRNSAISYYIICLIKTTNQKYSIIYIFNLRHIRALIIFKFKVLLKFFNFYFGLIHIKTKYYYRAIKTNCHTHFPALIPIYTIKITKIRRSIYIIPKFNFIGLIVYFK
jgi:hypothetical protein